MVHSSSCVSCKSLSLLHFGFSFFLNTQPLEFGCFGPFLQKPPDTVVRMDIFRLQASICHVLLFGHWHFYAGWHHTVDNCWRS